MIGPIPLKKVFVIVLVAIFLKKL